MAAQLQPLHAAEINLGKLFTEDFDFVIPEYQRPYSWGRDETLQLLSDLRGALDLDTDEPYFLGSVVLVKIEGSARSEVIDGQQRLTTLTLLLALLRDLVEEPGLSRAIHKFIEEPAVDWDDLPARPRLSLRPRDNDFFRTWVQTPGRTGELTGLSDNVATTDAQRALRDNARALREELSTGSQDDLQALFKMLGKRTFLVVVSTPDLNSAYRIFSVMNARGLPLSPPDIFKSQVIGAIREEDRERYARRWEKLEEDLGRDEFGDLFLYIRAVFARVRGVRGLLQEFPDQVLNAYLPGNGAGFIEDVLEPFANADLHLLRQDLEGPEAAWGTVNAWLKRLNQLGNDDWRPVALWALTEHGDDADYLVGFFTRLERLAANMLLRRVYATPRTLRYMELLRQLESGQEFSSPAFELSAEEKAGQLRALEGEIYLVRPVRKYVLLRLDSLLAKDPGVSYDHRVITVEHVLPQHPAPDSAWCRDFTGEQTAWWTHRLGNLLLLNRWKNSQAQNYDFEKKKQRYFQAKGGVSAFALTTQVLEQTQWTPEIVEARQHTLVGLLRDAWQLD